MGEGEKENIFLKRFPFHRSWAFTTSPAGLPPTPWRARLHPGYRVKRMQGNGSLQICPYPPRFLWDSSLFSLGSFTQKTTMGFNSCFNW